MKIKRVPRRSFQAGLGLHFTHSGPNGGPVLREQASWRTINGIWLNLPQSSLWIEMWRV